MVCFYKHVIIPLEIDHLLDLFACKLNLNIGADAPILAVEFFHLASAFDPLA